MSDTDGFTFTVLVLVALVTTTVTGPLLDLVDRLDRRRHRDPEVSPP